MKIKNFFIFVTSVIALLFFNSTIAIAGTCSAITMTDTQGIDIDSGKKMLLSEFEKAGDCTIATITENPKIAEYNAMIIGNSDLPPIADRLPDDPFVAIPNSFVGTHGGQLNHLGNAHEAGTAEFTSARNTNLVVFDDNLETFLLRKVAGSNFEGLNCMQDKTAYNNIQIIVIVTEFVE